MSDDIPIPEFSSFEEQLKSRAAPDSILGVRISYPNGGVRLRLKPPGLKSTGGCLLILMLVTFSILAYVALTGGFAPDDDPWTDLYAYTGLAIALLAGIIFAYALATKKAIIDLRDNKTLILTRKTLWRTKQQRWDAKDLISMGVHKSKERHDNTRLEIVTAAGEKVELLTDWPFLTLCMVAAITRTVLEIPKDAPYQESTAADQPSNTSPPESGFDKVAKEPVEVIFDTDTTVRKYPIRKPSTKEAVAYLVTWLVCVPIAIVLTWWMYFSPMSDDEVDLLACMYVLPLICIWFLSSACSVGLPFAALNALVADKWIELDKTHLGYRRRRLPAVNRGWPLSEIKSIDLYVQKNYLLTRVCVRLVSNESIQVCNGYELGKILPIFQDIASQCANSIEVRRLDAEHSYDG